MNLRGGNRGATTYLFLWAHGGRDGPSAPGEGVEKYSYLAPDDEGDPAPAQRGDERVRREQHVPYKSPTVALESQRAPLKEHHMWFCVVVVEVLVVQDGDRDIWGTLWPTGRKLNGGTFPLKQNSDTCTFPSSSTGFHTSFCYVATVDQL